MTDIKEIIKKYPTVENLNSKAAFQVASNALMQPYADKDYLQAIKEMFLSTAVPISAIKKVKRDE